MVQSLLLLSAWDGGIDPAQQENKPTITQVNISFFGNDFVVLLLLVLFVDTMEWIVFADGFS